MRSRLALAFAFASASALLFAASAASALDGQFEKTISFPKGGEVKLDWKYQDCTIQSMQVLNYPADLDIEKAKRENRNDHTSIGWEFQIDNRSSQKYEVKLMVEVLDKNGQVIKAGDRSPNVSAHSADNVKVTTRLRTVEAADAPKVRLRAAIIPR
jgi:preprotein translocase subunit SecF